MFTINLPQFPRPCTHRSLAEAVIGQLDREACRALLVLGIDRELQVRVYERLGFLADGY